MTTRTEITTLSGKVQQPGHAALAKVFLALPDGDHTVTIAPVGSAIPEIESVANCAILLSAKYNLPGKEGDLFRDFIESHRDKMTFAEYDLVFQGWASGRRMLLMHSLGMSAVLSDALAYVPNTGDGADVRESAKDAMSAIAKLAGIKVVQVGKRVEIRDNDE